MESSLSKTFSLRTVTAVGLLVALGTVASPFSIPVGVSNVYPVQHAINVLAGAILGPVPAVIAAFLTSTIRNLLGTGTLLAFPGSMFGALLAGLGYRYLKKEYFAAAGELIGTGLFGALAAFPVAKWLLGFSGLAYAFIVPFGLSSLAGSLIGLIILKLWNRAAGKKNGYDRV
jgi:energy coupling factor transporter S component ThiW